MNRCFSNGDVIGDYRLTGYCGGGGFGEVWLAETLTGGWPFALKIINDREKGEKELTGLSKFKACQHSHLIRIHHIGTTPDGRLYYTMDRADNAGSPEQYTADTLEYRIRKKKLSPEECYILAGKIAEALGCMHDNGLIHRDVKPGNIIFCNGEPVLADIGLVTVASPEVSLAGTPGFVPYYIFDGSHDPCPESDFYALGVTLKCALAGTADPQQALRYNDYSGSFSGKNGDLLRLWSQLSQSSKDFNRTTIHSAGDFVRCLKGEASGAVPETTGNLPEKKNHYYWNIAIVLSLLGLCVVGILIYISREKKETAVQRTGGEKNSVIKNTPPAKSKTQLEPVPVKKAEDMPEIRKLLEKYGWFSRRAASANDPFVARQIEAVQTHLQTITKKRMFDNVDYQRVSRSLLFWQQTEWLWRAKQMPEVKKMLDEFKFSPENEKGEDGNRLEQIQRYNVMMYLVRIGRTGRITKQELDSLRSYLKNWQTRINVTLQRNSSSGLLDNSDLLALLDKYKLPSELEQRMTEHPRFKSVSESIQRQVDEIKRVPHRHWGVYWGSLRETLELKKKIAEHCVPPGGKAEDIVVVKLLLEKYGWFSRRAASAQDPFVARQIESVKNYLQKITVQGRVQQGGEELRQLEEKYLRTWQQAEWAWTAKQMPEVKKLFDEFKLSPEEEKVAAGDYSANSYSFYIQNQLERIGRAGRVDSPELNTLRYYLKNRKGQADAALNRIPRKIPAGKKAEDMPEIRKLLKKYGWFNTAARAEIEKSGSGVYHSYFSYVPQIRNTLQKMTQSRQYTQDDLNRLENYYLASFRNEIKSAEDILRIKQHPEVKAVLSKFAFSEQYAAKYANRMSAVLLRQMANKKKITNSEFEQWRWWREHEWKEYRATLAKENKLPVMVPDREKIFSKSDEFLIKFRYFENNNWSESTFSVSGIENEEQMEKKVLSSPVFRFDKTMEFQIYSAEKVSGSVGEYNVIYLFRKDKKAGWQTLQRKMKSVPTVKIARNALFMQHIINDPECEIRIQRLERPAPAPVSFRYTSPVLTQKNEAVRYIDLSDVFSIPFSTEALLRNRNNRYLAEFYNFWSSEYVPIPAHIQNKLSEKIKTWQQNQFSKIPPSDAVWAEFVRRELDLVRKANAYCVRYGRPHAPEDSKKDFAGLVLAAELRRVALLQLESLIKNSKKYRNSELAGVPAVRYNQTWR